VECVAYNLDASSIDADQASAFDFSYDMAFYPQWNGGRTGIEIRTSTSYRLIKISDFGFGRDITTFERVGDRLIEKGASSLTSEENGHTSAVRLYVICRTEKTFPVPNENEAVNGFDLPRWIDKL
jgi:hypothetical protein